MPVIYGCGKGRIYRAVQTPHDPSNPKPSMYAPVKRNYERPASCKKVTVFDIQEGASRTYESIKEAASDIGCSETSIRERMCGRVKSLVYERYCVAVQTED